MEKITYTKIIIGWGRHDEVENIISSFPDDELEVGLDKAKKSFIDRVNPYSFLEIKPVKYRVTYTVTVETL